MRRSLAEISIGRRGRMVIAAVAGVALSTALLLDTGKAQAITTVTWRSVGFSPFLEACNQQGQTDYDQNRIADWICPRDPGSGNYDLLVTYQYPPNQGYQIVNQATGEFMDVRGGASGDGTPVIAYPNNHNSVNQQWGLQHWANGSLSLYTMVNDRSCADINGSQSAHAGSTIVIWGCTGQASQSWWVDLGNAPDYMQFRNVKYPSLCINSSGTGVPLWVGQCNRSSSTWKIATADTV